MQKRKLWILAVLTIIALVGAACAPTPAPEKKMTLEMAKRMIAAAEAKAKEMGIPFVITVVDIGGNLVAQERMEGALLASIDISRNKAYTAVALKMPTSDLAPLSVPGESLYGIAQTSGGRAIVFGGGFPIEVDGQLIGGIGVSGSSVENDMACAKAGLEAVSSTEPVPAPSPPTKGEKLTPEIAKWMIAAAEAKAKEMGIPFVITAVDIGGDLVFQERMDGALLASIDISRNKAYTAVALKMPTSDLAPLSVPGKSLWGIDKTSGGRVIVFGGGFPVKVDGKLIGGFGVSGSSVENDMACAKAGLEALKGIK